MGNLIRPGQELDTTAMESGLDLNRSGGSVWACSIKDGKCSKVNRAHPSAVREKRSVVDQGMDLVQDLDQHQDENIGQEQDTMTKESGLNRHLNVGGQPVNLCFPLLPCLPIG